MSAETPAFVAVSTGPRLDRIAAAVGQRIAGLLPLIALVVAWEGLARAHIRATTARLEAEQPLRENEDEA